MYRDICDALMNTGKGKGNPNICSNQKKLYESYRGNEDTIESYFAEFNLTCCRTPDPKIVCEWHELLEWYCDQPDAIFAIRSGNVSKSLRRGWLTVTDGGYSYFFTDNDFALYIYKMVLDGYCPKRNEFYDAMTKHDIIQNMNWFSPKRTPVNNYDTIQGTERNFGCFPVHFNKSGGKIYPDKSETEKNWFVINGPVCCLGKCGYKHSHIFDAGQNYLIDNDVIGIAGICAKYFPLGLETDYKWEPSRNNYVRSQEIPTNERNIYKKILKACFLRFVDPINHFLSPKKGNNKFTMSGGELSNDIAEYPPLLDYIKGYYSKIFGKEVFDCFAQDVLAVPYETNEGKEIINIEYWSDDKLHHTSISSVMPKNGGQYEYGGKYYSQRGYVYTAITDIIDNMNIRSFKELEQYFPKLCMLESDVKDMTRFHPPYEMLNGDRVCISNQIGNGNSIPKSRRFSELKKIIDNLSK